MKLSTISGDKLIKRWHTTPAGIVFMLTNHELQNANKLGWDTQVERAPKGEALSLICEDNFLADDFMYWLEDVIKLESKFPQLTTNNKELISTEEVAKRWNRHQEDLLETIQEANLTPVDPVGLELDQDELFSLINHYGCITPYDLIYRLSDVEQAEKQYPELKSNSKNKVFPKEILELMEKVKPEIDRIYDVLKEDNFHRYFDTKMKNAVLKEFRKNKSEFKYIQMSFIDDISLYQFNQSQAKRDFKGKLLKTLIEDRGFGEQSYQELYRQYLHL